MTKYWKIVSAGDYEVYAKKLLNLFETEKKYFDNVNPFWNPVKQSSNQEILSMIPELQELEKLYGKINEMTLLVLSGDNSTLHTDHQVGPNKGVQARLNVPVLNCEDSVTAFFELDEETFNTHEINKGETKYWSEHLRRTLKPVTQIVLMQPTILRTSKPHTVFCNGKKFPRISLTISFKEDLVKLLE